MVVKLGNATLVLDKIAAVLHDDNYAGESNTLLIFIEGVREGIPVKVKDAEKAHAELTEQIKKARSR